MSETMDADHGSLAVFEHHAGIEDDLPPRCIELLKMLRAIHRLEVEVEKSGIDIHVTNRIFAANGGTDLIDVRLRVRDTLGEAEGAFIGALFSDLRTPGAVETERSPIEMGKRINRVRDEIHIALNGMKARDPREDSRLFAALHAFYEASAMLVEAVPTSAG